MTTLLLLLLLLLCLGLGLVGLGAQKLAYAAGRAGTAGTIQVASCHDEGGSDSPSWVCSGAYRSADGRVVDQQARVKPYADEQDHAIDVRHVSGHDYSDTGGGALVTPVVFIAFGCLC